MDQFGEIRSDSTQGFHLGKNPEIGLSPTRPVCPSHAGVATHPCLLLLFSHPRRSSLLRYPAALSRYTVYSISLFPMSMVSPLISLPIHPA